MEPQHLLDLAQELLPLRHVGSRPHALGEERTDLNPHCIEISLAHWRAGGWFHQFCSSRSNTDTTS